MGTRIKFYTELGWESGELKRYTSGSTWVSAIIKVWNGSAWVEVYGVE